MTGETTNLAETERSIARLNTSLSILMVIGGFLAIASIYFGITVTVLFAWGLLFLIPILSAILYLSGRRRKLKLILQIRNAWGAPRISKQRDYQTIRPLFDNISSSDKSTGYIDEQTWKDLNMDQLYDKIDRTYTDPGEAVLYRILREPLFDKEELTERSRVIRFFQNNQKARESIQLVLIRLGHQFVHNDIFNLLWKDEFTKSRITPVFTILAVAAFLSLIIPLVFWSAVLVLIPVAVFIINMLIHYSTKRKKDLDTISYSYLISCIKTAKKLSSFTYDEIGPYEKRLEEQYKVSRDILNKARFLFPVNPGFTDPTTGFLFEYLNIFFLLEVRAFYATTDGLARHITELRELYLTIGELDALQSVASYRTSLSTYAEPEFLEEGIHLELKDAKQPLLENPVAVSITFNKNVVIITGSNMGGKSTFLRNIGNNALMAQTIATTVTSYYRGSFFRIVTSISRTDDLIAGKSFYYVEAERILKTIQSFSKNRPTLCIIDELLSGTNSTERLHASEAIIRYLVKQNSLAIIATHDMELASRLNGICDFYHFTDNVDENGLKFDYLLKPGVATTRNAIALLKYLGYPNEITEKTLEKD
jgi:hypothetical protein